MGQQHATCGFPPRRLPLARPAPPSFSLQAPKTDRLPSSQTPFFFVSFLSIQSGAISSTPLAAAQAPAALQARGRAACPPGAAGWRPPPRTKTTLLLAPPAPPHLHINTHECMSTPYFSTDPTVPPSHPSTAPHAAGHPTAAGPPPSLPPLLPPPFLPGLTLRLRDSAARRLVPAAGLARCCCANSHSATLICLPACLHPFFSRNLEAGP